MATEAGPTDVLDGRSARATRTRHAVVAALMALIEDGELRPTARRVAELARTDGLDVKIDRGSIFRRTWSTVKKGLTSDELRERLYRAKTRRHACDLQVRSPAGPVMIMRWPRDSST